MSTNPLIPFSIMGMILITGFSPCVPLPRVTIDLQASISSTRSVRCPEATSNELTSLIPDCTALGVTSAISVFVGSDDRTIELAMACPVFAASTRRT